MNYKDWLIDNEEDLALKHFNKEYNDLDEKQLEDLQLIANEEWVNFYSGWCDYVYENVKDRLMQTCELDKGG